MRAIVELGDLNKFEYCPMCGRDGVIFQRGDYLGSVYCLFGDCEWELDFVIVEEIRRRFPIEWKRFVEGDK